VSIPHFLPQTQAVKTADAANSAGDSAPATTKSEKLYRVGTLTYTKGALFQVFFWMLWGDFFFQLLESVTPALIPLQLRWEGASDTLIGFVGSQSAIVAFCLYPVIGMQSDRHRGRLGRRRPFILWCTPPVVLSLVLLGAAKPAGAVLHNMLGWLGGSNFTVASCTIVWIAICYVMWVIFNAYIAQVYSYLFVDVIPREVMGKFFGLYRAVGAIGNLAFNRWALGQAEAHTIHVYALIGLLYASAFYLIVWKVKEGDYPPPPPKKPGGGLAAARQYCKECFTHPFYLNVYCLSFFFWASLVPLGFIVFFATQAGQPGYAATLGLTLQEFGKVKSWTFLIQIPVFFLMGPLIDRFHPIRVSLVGMFLISVSYFSCYWLIQGAASLLVCWTINQGVLAIYLGAGAALTPRLLPREQYGQFFSANQTFGYSSMILTPPVCGFLLGMVRDYRYLFIFCGVCTSLAFLALITLYVQWKKLGGDRQFSPPNTIGNASPAIGP
jgi:MFS family permease